MTTRYEAPQTARVSKLEYFVSDRSGAELTFKRVSIDVLASVCGRYRIVRSPLGGGDLSFEGMYGAECVAFEVSDAESTRLAIAAVKRDCMYHAARLARAAVIAA